MSITYKPVEPAEACVGESMPESFVKEAERSRERFVSLIDETERLQAENAKLRELLDYMTPIAWYAASERERDRMRELGVEVEENEVHRV